MRCFNYGRSILQRCQRFKLMGRQCSFSCYSGNKARDAARALKPGDFVNGYFVQKVTEVPEFYMTAVQLQHGKTGAQHLHAAREDDNNAFSVMFRTTPMDSTGVPHILEHTVLCGSKQFPVRDPFFKMLSRSLATFMNALTAYDWTMYPFSTQNPQDFENLLSIYLDAAFRPLIRELDFCQEGWRLEPEDPKDMDSPLTFKGVVYNEMKGVYSSSQNLFATAALNQLMPSHTYGVNFGGDPKRIPDLTWTQLKDFHASHYHPSNARFFTYGNFPLENHLQCIGDYLKDFDRNSIDTTVPSEPRWKTPRQHCIACPPDPMAPDRSKQTSVAVIFLLSDITDTYEKFIQQIVCHLLTDGETSPFYTSLLATNIGSDYAPITGFQGNTKEGSYAVGLQGIKDGDVDKVIHIIDKTLDEVIRDGFDTTRIKAVLHKIELGQKHQTSNFGFHLSIGLSSHWNHDGDPVEAIQVNRLVERFSKDLADNPCFLQDKVQHYLKDNPHRLTLTMRPDDEYLAKQSAEEKERLSKKVATLSDQDRQQIIARSQELLEKQMTEEDLSCLPSLKVADINPLVKHEVVQIATISGVTVQRSEQPTNGVTYLRLVTGLPELPDKLLPMIPLFCNIITSIGAGGQDYRWMSQQQELYTGSMSASTHVVSHHTQQNYIQKALTFSSHCLEHNLAKMLKLWTLIFNSPDFSDKDRLTTLIYQNASELAASVPQAGHSYAMAHAASTLTPTAALNELFQGMTQVTLMKKIAETSDLSDVVQQLQQIASLVLNKINIRISINATPEAIPDALKQVEAFIKTLPGQPEGKPVFNMAKAVESPGTCTQFELPFSVNYVGHSVPTVPYTHPDRPALAVLGTLLSRMFLHREIREKGGAYGSGATAGDGVFTFFSYRMVCQRAGNPFALHHISWALYRRVIPRSMPQSPYMIPMHQQGPACEDPHSIETLKVFEDSIHWAVNGSFTQEELDQAKISIFQAIDKPVTPGNQGMKQFLDGVNDDMRQAYRDHLFAVSRQDIKHAAQKYLADAGCPQGTCCLGPANTSLQADSKWSIVREQ